MNDERRFDDVPPWGPGAASPRSPPARMRRAAAVCAALTGALGVAACGGTRYLEAVEVEPPAGARLRGETGPADPPAGQPLYRLEPAAGDAISFQVTVRSLVDEPVVVTGVRGDPGNNGVLIPERVEEAPATVAPGMRVTLTISGRAAGCEYDGQVTDLRYPRLQLSVGGEEAEQQVALDTQIELVAPRRGECGEG